MGPEPTESESLRRWRAGDAGAFESLYALASPRLAAFCRVLARDEGRAAELFQDAWSQAVARIGSYREDISFGAWLASIARHLWIDGKRREGAERRALEAHGAPAEAAVPPEATDLREILERLPEGEREAVLLYHLQGLSLREAAAVLGVTPWVVRGHLTRAQETLEKLLGKR